MASQLTLAECARTLCQQASTAVLSTLDGTGGAPYGSLVEIAVIGDGDIVLLLSKLAEHRRFLDADSRASILIAPHIHESNTLAKPRVTLQGRAECVGKGGAESDVYLQRRPDAAMYLSLGDFDFYRLRVERARYIAGFGRMDWLTTEQYRDAPPDPLWEIAPSAIEHMNDDHRDSVLLYARQLGGADWALSATLFGIDRLGMDIVAADDSNNETLRIAFDPALTGPDQLLARLVALSKSLRKA